MTEYVFARLSRGCLHSLIAAAVIYRFDKRLGDTITVAENLMGFSRQSSHGSLSNRRAFHAVSFLTLGVGGALGDPSVLVQS